MALTPVDPASSEIGHLSAVQVKFSGVHIGGGIYLTANHFPAAGGAGTAIPMRGLDGESPSHPTLESDFTMPADIGAWPDYLADDDNPATTDPVLVGFDMAAHLDIRSEGLRYDGPAAPMLIMADAADLVGMGASVMGYPVSPPNGEPARSTLYESQGQIILAGEEEVAEDLGRYWIVDGATALNGMSGGGTWVSYETPDGVTADYLIGTLSRIYETEDPVSPAGFGAISVDISAQYHDLAAMIEGLTGDQARSADDFARNLLMAGQGAGSVYTDVMGTFFHEDIWGSAAANFLSGGGGDDRLYGGEGDDTLSGGEGDDTLTGGAGRDLFTGFGGSGTDRITDFAAAEDVLDLSAYFQSLEEVLAAVTELPDGALQIDLSLATVAGATGGLLILDATSAAAITAQNTMVLCLAEDTLIATAEGARAAGDLRAGDLVLSLDHGPVPIVWIGRQKVTKAQATEREGLQSVTIEKDAFGAGLPSARLRLSTQHRVLVSGPIVARMTGVAEVFVRACDLIDLPEVTREAQAVTWVHLLCERHEVIAAHDLPVESLFPGPMAQRAALGSAAAALFLEEAASGHAAGLCRPLLLGKRARRLVQRHIANAKPLCRSFTSLATAESAAEGRDSLFPH